MTIHQISVFLENRAGQLAEITGLLAGQGVDLRAISIAETSDYGILRMIVDDSAKAAEVLPAPAPRSGQADKCPPQQRSGFHPVQSRHPDTYPGSDSHKSS